MSAPEIELSKTSPANPGATVALDLSKIASTTDTIYLLPYIPNKPVVYAIGPGGKLIRKIILSRPHGDWRPTGLRATELQFLVDVRDLLRPDWR